MIIPFPVLLTVTENPGAKVAPTFRVIFIKTEQAPPPTQSPDQEVRTVPDNVGVALKVTRVPGLNGKVQVAPQLIPAGELEIVP